MLARTLSGGFAPPAAWQTTAVFFMVLSAARKRYCFMCYKRYYLRAMIKLHHYLFDDFTGISHGNSIRGNIAHYHRTGTNGNIVTDCDTWQDGDAATNPKLKSV